MKKISHMNKLILFLMIFILFSSLTKSEVFSQSTVKVFSFNIRYNTLLDGKNAWANRKDMVIRTIYFHNIDIIGFQEALLSQVQDLSERLEDYGWTGVGRDDGKNKGEFTPVFFRKNRFTILNHGNFWLSESPDTPGSKGWDAACPRIVTWVNLNDKQTGVNFYYFNTHFDHAGRQARNKSAELLLSKIEKIAGHEPIILSGDFNCTRDKKPYAILTKTNKGRAFLENTMDLVKNGHYGGTQTFNGFDDTKRPGLIIDYIFVRNTGDILNHGIIAERWGGRFLSDHYPVLVELYLKPSHQTK